MFVSRHVKYSIVPECQCYMILTLLQLFVCVCVYIYNLWCVCVYLHAIPVNWEVIMVGGKCEQKSCSFQEQSAGKNCSFHCSFHFLSPFCNLSAVSFCSYSTCIVACSVRLQSFSANRLED
jgi:hypothetical protein